MASIKDVAKRAHVSPSTVSLVLNKKGYVSEETRRKVEAAVQELGYVPSEMARNLSLQRTKIIGVVFPDTAHPFYATMVHELELALYQAGYKTLLCSTAQRDNGEAAFVEMLRRHTMDALIVGTHSAATEIYEDLERPVIAFDRIINDRIPVLHVDHVKGGNLAAQIFRQQGCKHVAQIVGAQTVDLPANAFHIVCRQELEKHGIRVDNLEMARNAFLVDDFYQKAQELFERFPDVDGILGADLAACSCLRVAHDKGIRVPEDLKVIAYDGTYITRCTAPMLTAVVQPVKELAALAVESILKLVNGEKLQSLPVLQPELQRGGTA